jgi:5-methylcytosine-specific restriction endonuclease McrA
MAQAFSKAFYNSDLWKLRRAKILREDHYTCHDCDGRANEVHHIIELTPDNINDVQITLGRKNLMSLCGDCHKKRKASRSDIPGGFRFDEHGYVVPVTYPPGGRPEKY